VLVAPNLVATARHCVAVLTEGGSFSCTPSGELASGSTSGQLFADNTPSNVGVFTSDQVLSGAVYSGFPAAVGTQIFSTESPSVCRDDLAFVVLNQAVPGVAPIPIRLTASTLVGEPVSVSGYGLTGDAGGPSALRVRDDAQIVGIGPTIAMTLTQPAPVRSIRIGPGTVTCNGDSGGPIVSNVTGALIGLVSLGLQASPDGPFCVATDTSETTGPLLADYDALTMQAFAAAGAVPTVESDDDAASAISGDGDTDATPGIPMDSDADSAALVSTDGSGEASRAEVQVDDGGPSQDDGRAIDARAAAGRGSCTIGSEPHGATGARGAPVVAFAMVISALLKRRR